jgi:hypothetical protein
MMGYSDNQNQIGFDGIVNPPGQLFQFAEKLLIALDTDFKGALFFHGIEITFSRHWR